jgi:molecular chaperone IbpA
MRTFDFAPLYRSTVGFDRLFEMLDDGVRSEYPPYNIEKKSENDYRISMAVAGFAPDEIDLTQHGANLLVTGHKKKAAQDQRQMLHQGIAFRSFKQTFNLADYVKVADASLENGLLSIDLVREIPEELKPRRIDISSPGEKLPIESNRPTEVDQVAERPLKIA